MLITRWNTYSYIETYEMMRSIGGTGTNNGPFLAFHDGFVNMAQTVEQGGWDGFLNGWDRVAMDSHRYLCFSEPNNYGLTYQASLVRSVLHVSSMKAS